MRKTQILFKHNVGRLIKFHWFLKGNVKVNQTKSEEILRSHGYEIMDVQELLYPRKKKEEIEVIGLYDKELPKNECHPDYKTEPCYMYKNEDVLIEGLEQAKHLTNTVEICEGLPESLIEKEKSLSLPDEVHVEVIKKIKLCGMFEATQDKLPRRKDPLRPAWVFPREFGITDVKRNDLLCKNLAVICEQFSQNVNNKSIILDCFFSTPIESQNKKIQFQMTNGLVVTTREKLKVVAKPELTFGHVSPVGNYVDCTVSLNPYNFYVMQDIYPPGSNSKWPYVQTAFLHFNHTQVKCISEEEITESQIQARSLLNGFCIAVAEARALFGFDVKKLPEPVIVPVVQTDGKMFHFSIFQLNTLDLKHDSEVKNIFWHSERIPLYSTCEYRSGRPVLDGYNPDVIKKIMCFYNTE